VDSNKFQAAQAPAIAREPALAVRKENNVGRYIGDVMGKHICTDVSIYANVDKELKCNVVSLEGTLTINYRTST